MSALLCNLVVLQGGTLCTFFEIFTANPSFRKTCSFTKSSKLAGHFL